MDPTIQYAKTSDGVNIAYFGIGAGAPVVYVPPGGNAGQVWQQPEVRSWLERLAAKYKVIRLDYRGVGLSDHGWKFSPELTARDVEAVVRKEGLQRFALLGQLHTTSTVVVFASRHPEAVSHLILWCPYASSRDYVDSSPALQAAIAAGEKDWQTLSELIGLQAAGWADADQARRFAGYLRAGVDTDHYIDMEDFDLRPLLSRVTTPVLVLHRREVPFPTLEVARQVASNMANARFLLLEGSALLPFFGDTDSVLTAIDDFLGEAASWRGLLASQNASWRFLPCWPAAAATKALPGPSRSAAGRSNDILATFTSRSALITGQKPRPTPSATR